MLLGLSCALIAAVAYGSASVLQAAGVRRVGAPGHSANNLTGLRHQPLFFLGLALDGLGFIAGVVALQFLPLFLVQAVVAASVGVTALIAVINGATLGRSGWIALAAAGLGLILLSLSAASETAQRLPLGWRWVLLAAAVPIGALALIGPHLGRRAAAPILALSSGLGFAVVAIAARTLVFPDPLWKIFADPALWAILASGLAGMLLFAMALQAGSVTSVAAVTFTTESVLPAIIGLAFLGDQVRSGDWPMAAAGFIFAVGGAVALSRFADAESTTKIPKPVDR